MKQPREVHHKRKKEKNKKKEVQSMNPVTVRDFEKIKGLSELRAAPDGRHAVFCVTQADIQDNCYKSHLELLDVETGETRPLTAADGRG